MFEKKHVIAWETEWVVVVEQVGVSSSKYSYDDDQGINHIILTFWL